MTERVARLIHAVEGECDGLAIGNKTAQNILRYVDEAPIDMILHCPKCHTQHIDAPEAFGEGGDCLDGGWTNRPHRSHLCGKCGTIWRPADVCTNGVASIATRGKSDTWSLA